MFLAFMIPDSKSNSAGLKFERGVSIQIHMERMKMTRLRQGIQIYVLHHF